VLLPYSQIEQYQLPRLRGVGRFIQFRCADTSVIVAVPRFRFFLALFAVINSCKTWTLYSQLVEKVYRTSRMQPGDKLIEETEWWLSYRRHHNSTEHRESKFMIRTARITFTELCLRWPGWSPAVRLDFCHAVSYTDQENAADIFGFLARDETETSA
jgi:hypothetical protein